MKIILPGERPISWNTFYAGRHWTMRNAQVQRVHWAVVAALTTPVVYTGRVDITIVAYFEGRRLDPDNITAKLYIDALKGTVLVNDSGVYIRSVTTRSEKDNVNPRVEIIIEEISHIKEGNGE